MANVNLTRNNRFNEKRDISVFTAKLKVSDMPTSGDVYQLFQLPRESVVIGAQAIVLTANDAATSAALDLGFGGDDTLIDGGDLKSVAGTALTAGTNAVIPAVKATGGIVTATPTYVGAPTAGEILVIVRYVEYTKVTGELTDYVKQ